MLNEGPLAQGTPCALVTVQAVAQVRIVVVSEVFAPEYTGTVTVFVAHKW